MVLSLGDVERAIAASDPQLGELIVRYLAQRDPEPGRSELDQTDEEDDDAPLIDVPAGAYTYERLRADVGGGLKGKNPTERKLARREAFAAAESSPFAPPRLRLGKILLALYERGDPAGRAALIYVFQRGSIQWGVWQAAKAIYKLAEERHDAALFGVLAYRIDAMTQTDRNAAELGAGTLTYLRRRAWRYLRLLGHATPDAYPTFAIEVLRHYPGQISAGQISAGQISSGPTSSGTTSSGAASAVEPSERRAFDQHSRSWVAAQIWGHGQMRYDRDAREFAPPSGPDALAKRAFPQAWKVSPSPLLRLLESAENDLVCEFAIRSLRGDHPLALRAVEPRWLARLGRRPVAAIHGFVVQLLNESPELHQSKLRELGLHEVVIGFLRSPSADARAYALEYAAAHAHDLAVADLVELVEGGQEAVKKFALARLEAMTPQQLGIAVLCRLLGQAAWVAEKLPQGFSPRDIDAALFVDTAARGTSQFNALVKFFNDKNVMIPAPHFTKLVDDPRFTEYQLRAVVNAVMAELAKRSAREIGIAWIQKAVEDRNRTPIVTRWLEAGMLAGNDLDVEWLKALVGKPRLRPLALKLLGDRRLVEPARVGLPWLLELARSSDSEIANFAQRMLLESFEPQDFANGDRAAGVARLWELASGKKQPEAVRTFAATYLKAHHPDLGPRLAESRSLGIKPRLDHEAYPMGTVRPLLRDEREDVRRLAVAITGEEIARWSDPDLVYELATSKFKEPRTLGSELLMGVIVVGEVRRVPAAWVDGRRLFQLAESSQKSAREVALTLIRKLYDQVGGAERLAWLMDSPDRDVRLFAVRLFWDRHRPKPWPADYVPRKLLGIAVGTQRFADVAALRQFARTVLFGLPPGRVGERDPVAEGAPQPERALPASIAKRRLIEAIRDLGLEDIEFARAIAPVLGEFTESAAKGEWQASVQALTAMCARHRELGEVL